jgi:hypothetical protein
MSSDLGPTVEADGGTVAAEVKVAPAVETSGGSKHRVWREQLCAPALLLVCPALLMLPCGGFLRKYSATRA